MPPEAILTAPPCFLLRADEPGNGVRVTGEVELDVEVA